VNESARPPRWLWPWLHVAGAVLLVSYPVLWQVEFYAFVFAFLVSGPLFFLAFALAFIVRLAKKHRPMVDRPAIVLLLIMVAAQVAAIAALRTVNWC